MNILVIPSIREHCFHQFLESWQEKGDWDSIILIEDSPEKTFKNIPKEIHHFSHKEIKKKLGKDAWIISKKDSACRCFGFLIAKELGANHVITLDDDVYISQSFTKGICQSNLDILNNYNICQPSAGVRTRGLPYKNLGKLEIKLNMNLWEDVGDWDGLQGVQMSDDFYFNPPKGNFIAHPKLRYPLCGMALFFHISILPAMYFPLMGEKYPYKRSDDLWCGWINQKVFDQCGINWSIGEPIVKHSRASDPFINLIKEAPGLKMNETLWQLIYDFKLKSKNVADCTTEIGILLEQNPDPYLSKLGKALQVWVRLASGEVLQKLPGSLAERKPKFHQDFGCVL